MTLVLLAGAGLMMRSFLTLYRLDVGVDTAHLLTMRLALPAQKYPTIESRRAFFERLDQRIAGVSGIQAGMITTNMPLGGGNGRLLAVEGRPLAAGEQAPSVTQVMIGPRYFETLGLANRAGPRLRRSRRDDRAMKPRSSTSGSRRCISEARIRSDGESS